MNDNFSTEIRTSTYDACAGYCQCSKECGRLAEQAHHRASNTEANRKLYPLFIQSPFNIIWMNSICHLNKPLPDKPNEAMLRVYEDYLEELRRFE